MIVFQSSTRRSMLEGKHPLHRAEALTHALSHIPTIGQDPILSVNAPQRSNLLGLSRVIGVESHESSTYPSHPTGTVTTWRSMP